MHEFFLVFIGACLVNNLVLDYLVGVSPALASSRRFEVALGLSLSMLLLVPITTLSTHLLYRFLLVPYELEFLQVLAFVICIIFVARLLELSLRKFKPSLHQGVKVFIPLLLVNSALLGVALLNSLNHHGLLNALALAAGSALGFSIMVITFSALREKLEVTDVPEVFRGPSITVLTLGILSMAFMGFSGMS